MEDVELFTGEFNGLAEDWIVLMVGVDTHNGGNNIHKPGMKEIIE
jgi:hypothetical protein